jgi:hypothetical protein
MLFDYGIENAATKIADKANRKKELLHATQQYLLLSSAALLLVLACISNNLFTSLIPTVPIVLNLLAIPHFLSGAYQYPGPALQFLERMVSKIQSQAMVCALPDSTGLALAYFCSKPRIWMDTIAGFQHDKFN